jgi:hypothetical protein
MVDVVAPVAGSRAGVKAEEALPPTERAAPRTKSSWPPVPLTWCGRCPRKRHGRWRSTIMVLLIETIRGFAAIATTRR